LAAKKQGKGKSRKKGKVKKEKKAKAPSTSSSFPEYLYVTRDVSRVDETPGDVYCGEDIEKLVQETLEEDSRADQGLIVVVETYQRINEVRRFRRAIDEIGDDD
jgi:hypothetical protein